MDITFVNNGQLIEKTNYWGSPREGKGEAYCSVHAGALRLLMPRAEVGAVGLMCAAKYVILSRGPGEDGSEAMQLTFQTISGRNSTVQISSTCVNTLPEKPQPGREWTVSVWVLQNGPHKVLQLPCRWRRSKRLPDHSPWSEPRKGPVTTRSVRTARRPANAPDAMSVPLFEFGQGSPNNLFIGPDGKATTNIIGLPRILSMNGGERLMQLLALTGPDWREAFVANSTVQRWARVHGVDNLKATPKLICAFYANAKYRQHLLLMYLYSKVGWPFPGNDTLCLEWEIFNKYFQATAHEAMNTLIQQRIGPADINEVRARSTLAINKLKEVTGQFLALFETWQTLELEKREAAILGLFALLAFNCTDAMIKVVEEVFAGIKEEFLDLRVVSRKKREPRPPTAAHLGRIHKRCGAQIKLARECAVSLMSDHPGNAGIARLEREVAILTRIVRARDRLSCAANASGKQ